MLTITSSLEENVSTIVACVPALGPLFAFFSDKLRSLSFRRHHTELEERARPSRKQAPISLGSVTRPACPAVRYESSAEPLCKPFQGIYGSQISLAPGIQKTTRVDVLRVMILRSEGQLNEACKTFACMVWGRYAEDPSNFYIDEQTLIQSLMLGGCISSRRLGHWDT